MHAEALIIQILDLIFCGLFEKSKSFLLLTQTLKKSLCGILSFDIYMLKTVCTT